MMSLDLAKIGATHLRSEEGILQDFTVSDGDHNNYNNCYLNGLWYQNIFGYLAPIFKMSSQILLLVKNSPHFFCWLIPSLAKALLIRLIWARQNLWQPVTSCDLQHVKNPKISWGAGSLTVCLKGIPRSNINVYHQCLSSISPMKSMNFGAHPIFRQTYHYKKWFYGTWGRVCPEVNGKQMTQNSRVTPNSPTKPRKKTWNQSKSAPKWFSPKIFDPKIGFGSQSKQGKMTNSSGCPSRRHVRYRWVWFLKGWNVDEFSNCVFETITDSLGSYPYLGWFSGRIFSRALLLSTSLLMIEADVRSIFRSLKVGSTRTWVILGGFLWWTNHLWWSELATGRYWF